MVIILELGIFIKRRKLLLLSRKAASPQPQRKSLNFPVLEAILPQAIGSLAFNLDLAVLDGNVIRVLSRLFAYDKDARSTSAKKELQQMADELLVAGEAGDFNEAMMELGATVCMPKNPACSACPSPVAALASKRAPHRFPV